LISKLLKKCVLLVFPLLWACQSSPKEEVVEEIEIEILATQHNSNSSFRGISVFDSNTVWISGSKGTIIRSLDGGKNWESVPSPDLDSLDYRDVHAFSSSSAIISSAGFPARVYRTEDAGENWQLVYENLDSSAFLNSIHFIDSNNGLILGDRLGGYHFILHTQDAGLSWNRVDSTELPSPLSIEHGFAASGSCITFNSNGDYVIGLGGEKNRVILGSVGKQWKSFDVGLGDSLPTSGIYSICSEMGMIMAVGGDYSKVDAKEHCYISTDQGKTWSEGGLLNGYRSIVDHDQKNNIWIAAGSNGIEYSLSKGSDWRHLSDLEINTLQFDDLSGTAFMAGPKGKVFTLKVNIR